jgi:O-antigen ligase
MLSGIYSDNTDYWADRCRIKLPFLALPLAFTGIKPFTKRMFNGFILFYFYVIVISGVAVFINYLMHYDQFNEQISRGQPIPAPLGDHIRFSLEIAFAIAAGFYLWVDKYYFHFKWEPHALMAGSILLIVLLHILAVRSGLLAFYLVSIILLGRWIIVRKKFITGSVLLLLLVSGLWAALHYIPSLRNKLNYFNYEWQPIKDDKINAGHNDAQRLLSIRYGFILGARNPLTGVGAGDIKEDMQEAYLENDAYKDVIAITPHNQFIYVFAATGSIGTLFFIAAVLYPLLSQKRYKFFLFTAFHIIILFSLLSEHTFEIQVGTAFYLLFLLLLRHYIDHNAQLPSAINNNA